MFERTQKQASTQQGHAPVAPDEPVMWSFKASRVLWAKLFSGVAPRDQPSFVVLFQRGKALEVAEPGTSQAQLELFRDKAFNEAILVPLFERIKDLYGEQAHALLTQTGRVWVCDEQDAVQCLVLNEPPRDPNEARIEVHPFISRSWDFANAFAQTRNERIKFFGLIAFFCALVLLAGFGLSWIFAVYQLGKATNAVIAPLKMFLPPMWVCMLFAVMFSAIEILGIVYRPVRTIALFFGLADFMLHAWYGRNIGMAQGDTQSIVFLWTLGFSALSVVPEVATIYFGGICFYLAPLAGLWLPMRAGSILWTIPGAYNKHRDDTVQAQQGSYTVIDGRDTRGAETTRFLRGD